MELLPFRTESSGFFDRKELNEKGISEMRHIEEAFEYLLQRIDFLQGSESFDLCKIKLLDACSFAKRAVALNVENQLGQ